MKKIIKPFDFKKFKWGAKVEPKNGNKIERISIEYSGEDSVVKYHDLIPVLLKAFYFDDEGRKCKGIWNPSNGKWYGPFPTPSLDLVIVEYEDEEDAVQEEEKEDKKPISEEVELGLTYCDNGLYYEVHYKNDDSNSDKYLVCSRDEQANKLGEYLLSLVRDRMDSGLTNKVKIEMKLTPIKD